MKKILIIITTEYVLYGGLTTVMMNYYRAMDKADLKIDFASTNIPDRILLEELGKNGSKYFYLGNRKKKLFRYLSRLNYLLKNNRYDVVHVNGNSSTMMLEMAAAKKHNVSVRIAQTHTTCSSYPLLNRLLRRGLKRTYSKAVAVSQKAGKCLYGQDDFLVLSNAIDVDKYRFDETTRMTLRQQLGIREKFVIGHVGKIYEPKNHMFLLKIFSELRKIRDDACLILVGGGPMEAEIKEECRRLGIEDDVIFAGMRLDVENFLQAMDVFVFPSLWEGMPLALLEAQASGLRCIVSSEVAEEAKCLESFVFKNLSDGAASWAEEINRPLSTNLTRRAALQCLTDKGFNIHFEAVKLRKLYLE